jgi:ribosomal protein S18 acetylase RimI-like enzyme
VAPRFEPMSSDPSAGRRFVRRALEVRGAGGREPTDWTESFEARLADGSVQARLWTEGGRASGLVSWSPGGPLGVSVHLLYSAAEGSDPGAYGNLLGSFESEFGPVAFLSGPLAGLVPASEERVLVPQGYARFSRSEMTWNGERAIAEPSGVAGERQRPALREDLPSLASLHREAYHGSLDRYLFLEEEDEERDAYRAVREILEGRWGELVDAGSWVAERDGQLAGLVLTVGTDQGALIADVAVAPKLRRSGIAQRLITTAVRSLRAAGAGRIYLNVTDGNLPAVRLYQGLGFVRSLGPTLDWYRRSRFPGPGSPSEGP